MANVLRDGRVWNIDSPGGSVITQQLLSISKIRWISDTASAGDDAIIQNAAGVELWRSRATGPNYVEESEALTQWSTPVQGLIVPTLDSGELFIHLR